MSSQLVIEDGGRAARYLLGEHNTIGRDPQCTVALANPMVSRRHAELHLQPDRSFKLVHTGTTHATFLNGVDVKEAVLKHGDELTIGGISLRFEVVASEDVPLAQVVIDGDAPKPAVHSRKPIGDWQNRKLQPAYVLLRELVLATDMDNLLTRMLDAGFELFEPDRMVVLLTSPYDGQLVARRARTQPELGKHSIRISRSVIHEAVSSGQAVLSIDAGADPRFAKSQSISTEGILSVMCCPMFSGKELLGVVYLDSKSMGGLFEEEDVELLALFGAHTALAIHAATLRDNAFRNLVAEKNRLETLVNHLPEAIFVLDAGWRILLANTPAQQLLRDWGVAGAMLDKVGGLEIAELVESAREQAVPVSVGGATLSVRAVLLSASTLQGVQTLLIMQKGD